MCAPRGARAAIHVQANKGASRNDHRSRRTREVTDDRNVEGCADLRSRLQQREVGHTADVDFAFVVDAELSAQDLMAAAAGADKALIDSVGLFDVYEGEGIGAGKKSLAIFVRLQPREKTLTDEEIDAVAEKIVSAVSQKTDGVLRG